MKSVREVIRLLCNNKGSTAMLLTIIIAMAIFSIAAPQIYDTVAVMYQAQADETRNAFVQSYVESKYADLVTKKYDDIDKEEKTPLPSVANYHYYREVTCKKTELEKGRSKKGGLIHIYDEFHADPIFSLPWEIYSDAAGNAPSESSAKKPLIFLMSGTYTPPKDTSPDKPVTVKVLCVGGGAGGGQSTGVIAAGANGSGGGGSGYVSAKVVTLTSASPVSVVVGAGGPEGSGGSGSSFGSYVSAPGGYTGGSGYNLANTNVGGDGGSGGACGGMLWEAAYSGSNGADGTPRAPVGYRGGKGQGTIITKPDTICGVTFSSATFSAGGGGSNLAPTVYAMTPGGAGAGGIIVSSTIFSGSASAGKGSGAGGGPGGQGYGAGGGGAICNYVGTSGSGAPGVVYIEQQ